MLINVLIFFYFFKNLENDKYFFLFFEFNDLFRTKSVK